VQVFTSNGASLGTSITSVNAPIGICLPPIVGSVYAANCGNGVLDPGEQCDDGRPASGDGCSSTCELEPCWVCPVPGQSCIPAPSGAACVDDGNLCTADVCDGHGMCSHDPVSGVVACADDGNPCTDDVCGAGVCTHPPVSAGSSCPDDGNPCTSGGTCDGNGACIYAMQPNDTPCDDGSFCDGAETCHDGICISAGNPCGVCGTCDEAMKSCMAPKPDGTLCAEPEGCSLVDNVCSAGVCTVDLSCDPLYSRRAFALDRVALHTSTKTPANGKTAIHGLLDGNFAGGGVVNDLTTDGLRMEVIGQAGVIDTLVWNAGECSRSRNQKVVTCTHTSGGGNRGDTAKFRALSAFPNTYAVAVNARNHSIGGPLAAEPLRVSVQTMTLDSRDDSDTCIPNAQGTSARCGGQPAPAFPTYTPTPLPTATSTPTPTA